MTTQAFQVQTIGDLNFFRLVKEPWTKYELLIVFVYTMYT
jgi:hypothetical protein